MSSLLGLESALSLGVELVTDPFAFQHSEYCQDQSHLCSECSHRGWIEGSSIKISLLRGPDRFAGPHLAFITTGSLLQYKSINVSFPKNLTELTMIEATSQNHLISNFFNHGRPPNYSAARSKFFLTTGKYFRYLKLTGCGRWTYLCGADV